MTRRRALAELFVLLVVLGCLFVLARFFAEQLG